MQVHRRLVIHVQGYDARGLVENYEFFRREYQRTCELYGLTGETDAAEEAPKVFSAAWDATTRGDGWQVTTRYRLLRFDDLVREDTTRAPWWKIVQMYRTIGIALLNGAFIRMLRTNWRFALVAFAPILLITMWVLLGSFVGILCMNLVGALGAPVIAAKIVGAVTGVGGFGSLLWLSEPLTGLLRRCDEAASIDQFVNGKRPDWSERLDAFAGEIADAVNKSKADEVVIVGHGFGAVLAINVLGRALARDGALGSHGPRVALLTLGREPAGGRLQPGGQRLPQPAAPARDRARHRLDRRPVARRHSELRPVRSHRRSRHRRSAGDRRNPHVVHSSDIRLAAPGCAVCENATPDTSWRMSGPAAAYDYTLICCGPLDLVTRATKPQQAEAALAGKFEPDPVTAR